MALVGEDRDYFARCYKCKRVFDIVSELSGFGDGEVGDYFETYVQSFMCRECFGILKHPLTSCRHLLSLRETIANYFAQTFQELRNMALNFNLLIKGYTAATELPSPATNHFKLSALTTDDNAMHLLRAYGDSRYDTHTAINITGDGDCLFNSVSLAFW